MKRSAWRLIAATVLFLGWIGYLAFLAATTTEPIILSRSQFLAADLYVIAEVDDAPVWPTFPDLVVGTAGLPAAGLMPPDRVERPGYVVTVKEVIWAADATDAKRTRLIVKNLADSGVKRIQKGEKPTWERPGHGQYIMALSHTADGSGVFRVTPEPRTPGFAGELPGSPGGPIYPVTTQTREQLAEIKAQYHP
jgi:hypothetical protein